MLQRKVLILHPAKIRIDLVLLDHAAEADDVSHSRNHFELSLHDPVLDRAQLLGVELVAFQPIAKDFADGRGERRQCGLDSCGKIGTLKPLQHLLTGEVVVHLIVESKHQEREAKLSMGKHPDRMWQTAQGNLQGNSDLLLDFLGSVARKEGNDGDLYIRNVREGLDRKGLKGGYSARHKEKQHQQQKQRLVQRKRYDASDHETLLPPISTANLIRAESASGGIEHLFQKQAIISDDSLPGLHTIEYRHFIALFRSNFDLTPRKRTPPFFDEDVVFVAP